MTTESATAKDQQQDRTRYPPNSLDLCAIRRRRRLRLLPALRSLQQLEVWCRAGLLREDVVLQAEETFIQSRLRPKTTCGTECWAADDAGGGDS